MYQCWTAHHLTCSHSFPSFPCLPLPTDGMEFRVHHLISCLRVPFTPRLSLGLPPTWSSKATLGCLPALCCLCLSCGTSLEKTIEAGGLVSASRSSWVHTSPWPHHIGHSPLSQRSFSYFLLKPATFPSCLLEGDLASFFTQTIEAARWYLPRHSTTKPTIFLHLYQPPGPPFLWTG